MEYFVHTFSRFKYIQHFVFIGIWVLTANSLAQEAIDVVGVAVSEQQLSEHIPISGSVYSSQISDLTSRVEGWVDEIKVDAGDHVEAGNVLIALDDANVKILKEEAAAIRDEALINKNHKHALMEKALSLIDVQGISETELRISKSEYQTAEAQLRVAEAKLKKIDLDLSRHVVVAPFSGTVTQRYISVGEWAEPGTPLIELIDNKSLQIDFQIPQRLYPRIDKHSSLDLVFDSYPGKVFKGSVHKKVPITNGSSRTFLLRAAFSHVGLELTPGMAVSGTLKLPGQFAVAVPRDALIRYPDGRITVWVAEGPNWNQNVVVSEKPVGLGISSNGWVEVVSGLSAGEVVITVGNEGLHQKQNVVLKRST